MNNLVRLRVMAAVGIMAMLAGACGRSKDDGTQPPTTETTAPKVPAAAPGFDPMAMTINVGVISPSSGPVAVLGNPLTAGAETWFNYINDTCSLIQDDAYGEAGQRGIEFAAKELGYAIKTTAKYSAGTPDFTAQVVSLKSSGCQLVYLVAMPTDTAKVMGTSAQLQFAPKWVGQAPTWTGTFVKSPLAPYLQANFMLTGEGTEWGDTSVAGMGDMLARVQKFTPNQQPDIHFTFGYNQARAVTALLEKAIELGDMSRAGILDALTKIGKVEFDGLSADYLYGPVAERNPPRETTIYKVDPTKAGGLAKVKYQHTSEAAKKYEIKPI